MLLTIRDLVTELREVLARPKFDRYLTTMVRDEFLAAYILEAEWIAVTESIAECRDPKDDKVLEAAINGQATCVISGDDDLLVLSPFRGVDILPPAGFIQSHSKIDLEPDARRISSLRSALEGLRAAKPAAAGWV